MSVLTKARRSTSARMRSCELPDCWLDSSAAAEAHLLERRETGRDRIADRRDLARESRKARRAGR